jgi:hypothetical protein
VPRNTAPRVDAADTDARCLELRRAGLSYRDIARTVGLSVANVHGRVTRGLDRTRREPADGLRELELDRLDVLQVVLTQVLRREHVTISGGKVVQDEDGRSYRDDGPVVAAAQALVRVQESRRRLLGLDAPAKVEAKILTVDVMDARIAELESLLAASDPDWEQPTLDDAGLVDQFRRAWSIPGRAAADVAGFVAAALELAIGLLPVGQDRVADAVDAYLAGSS